MADLQRVRVVWTGDAVTGGGVSTFYFDAAATGFVANLRTFFDGMKSVIAGGVTWTFPGQGDVIDSATGEITGTWTEATPADVNSSGIGVHAQGVGARVTWGTAAIRNGRRVRGSTFLVPLTAGCYADDGTIETGILTLMRGVVSSAITDFDGAARIYSRPDGTQAGAGAAILSGTVPDRVSWLRSRRT